MKRQTAEKNLKTVIQRLHEINGLLATPLHNWDALKIKRAWLFGSFAKGDMKKVSVHIVGHDRCFDSLDKTVLIYPRCDFEFKLN